MLVAHLTVEIRQEDEEIASEKSAAMSSKWLDALEEKE